MLTATEKFFAAESPSAHVKVPLAAVKSVPATAVSLVVEKSTLVDPLEPPTRFTLTVREPTFCATVKEDAPKLRVPRAICLSPVMVTTAEAGLDTCAAGLGAVSSTSNVLLPKNGVAVPMGMEIVFGVESFSAHCKTPDLLAKSLPATAVCETVV